MNNGRGFVIVSVMSARTELIDVLLLTRKALAEPDNDFAWSSWEGHDDAIAEMDKHVAALRSGASIDPRDLQVLFVATGPICEVSLSSGWSDAYLRLAERFDTALERFVARLD